MSQCCDPVPYRRLFNEKAANRSLRKYRRRGLDARAAGLVRYLIERGVAGKTVLEIGGGIGHLQVELLKAGAASATNVELSDGYEAAAQSLFEEEGLSERVQRRLGDIVEGTGEIGTADIVVMNRVVCCYPWMDRMMEAATSRAGLFLAMTFPRDRWLNHLLLGGSNLFDRVRNSGFEAFVHPVAAIEAFAAGAGLTEVFSESDTIWTGVVFERAGLAQA